MQPCLARGLVVPAVHVLVKHMRVIASESDNLLLQPAASLNHQLLVATVPQLTAMRYGARDATARRLDGVVPYLLGIDGRQLAMPVYDSARARADFAHYFLAIRPSPKTEVLIRSQSFRGQLDWGSSASCRLWPPGGAL